MKKKKKDPFEVMLKRFLIPVLRRATYRWKPRDEALKEARVERGNYKCAICGEIFKRKEIVQDHIEPVIDVEKGFTDWNDYVLRMFPDKDGFQILCKPCHDAKTIMEDELRKLYNQKRKDAAKVDKKKK
jgi:5-methylcytosine-specific restriction endonuclease McrA